METTIAVIYDGEVFRPEIPPDLVANQRYWIRVVEKKGADEENAWAVLSEYCGSVDAPEDWAKEHDHYLYGTAKVGMLESIR
jgi:hypothetical protein